MPGVPNLKTGGVGSAALADMRHLSAVTRYYPKLCTLLDAFFRGIPYVTSGSRKISPCAPSVHGILVEYQGQNVWIAPLRNVII